MDPFEKSILSGSEANYHCVSLSPTVIEPGSPTWMPYALTTRLRYPPSTTSPLIETATYLPTYSLWSAMHELSLLLN